MTRFPRKASHFYILAGLPAGEMIENLQSFHRLMVSWDHHLEQGKTVVSVL